MRIDTTPTGRVIAYDALRVFAIVSVVGIHSLMPYRDLLAPDTPVRLLDDLLHYAVPLFVFISGALVWGRPWPSHPGAYRRFLVRRGTAIGLPYLAWAAAYALIFTASADKPLEAVREVPALLASGHIWYHLYFIPMLLTFYLLTPLASRAVRFSPELLVVGAYVLRIAAGPELAELARDLLGTQGWSWATHVLTHLPHMALGAWFAMRLGVLPRIFMRSWPASLAVGFGGLLAIYAEWLPAPIDGWTRVLFPAAMAAAVLGLVLAAFALEPRLEPHARTVTALGALAFGVYFVHPLLLEPVFRAVAAADASWLWLTGWFGVLVFAIATGGSFAVAEAFSRSRLTSWLVGLPPAHQGQGITKN